MRIRAFQGLRPREDVVERVASLPYDVVTTEEARELASANPLSMLHVVRPEIDLPIGSDPYSNEAYARAVENFRRMQGEEVLVRETEPVLYLYEQVMGSHRQRGIAALCFVEDYEDDRIKKHEKTRRDKEDDRTRLTSDLSANPGPVFLAYRDRPEIDRLVEGIARDEPLVDFVTPDAVTHRVWRISDPAPFVDAFQPVPSFYVADGHHRAASAARVGKERAAANPRHTGEEDYNAFLCVLFPGSQLNILPYNRLVLDLNGLTPEALLARVRTVAEVEANGPPQPHRTGEISMYLDGAWYRLRFRPDDGLDPAARLDVSLLQESILAPFLNIADPRTSERITFVGGIRGVEALTGPVDAGKAAVAFAMHPVAIDELMSIADANQIMPPKSTWFEPKLRSGLFIHTFEPAAE